MRFTHFIFAGKATLGVREGDEIRVLGNETLESLLARGVDLLTYGKRDDTAPITMVKATDVKLLPVMLRPGKIICVGLNYAAHTEESPYEQPPLPTLFLRVSTSLIADGQPLVRPVFAEGQDQSAGLDFEGEMAVVLKSGGRHISKSDALSHVAGYSVFNDASVREYQFNTSQWTVGKNFDGTGAFGPNLVTVDEVPAGGRGLKLETRVNDQVVQSDTTDNMIYDVESIIEFVSRFITLEAGDLIVSGTPSGIGWAREPKLLMKAGDVCTVTIEGLGTLTNTVVDAG